MFPFLSPVPVPLIVFVEGKLHSGRTSFFQRPRKMEPAPSASLFSLPLPEYESTDFANYNLIIVAVVLKSFSLCLKKF